MISFPWNIKVLDKIYRRDSKCSPVEQYEVIRVGDDWIETKSTGKIAHSMGDASWKDRDGGTAGKTWNPSQSVIDKDYHDGLILSPITMQFFDPSA